MGFNEAIFGIGVLLVEPHRIELPTNVLLNHN